MQKTLDNFESAIYDICHFNEASPQGEDFYFIQIIKRKKDNPDMQKDVSIKDRFFIYNSGDFLKLRDKIIKSCQFYNARAYLNVNRRNTKKVGLITLKLITEEIIKENFKEIKNSYITACGSTSSDPNKKWIIDVDKSDNYSDVINFINNNTSIKLITSLFSVNGYHLITYPFDPREFKKTFPNIQILYDGATVLWAPVFNHTFDSKPQIGEK